MIWGGSFISYEEVSEVRVSQGDNVAGTSENPRSGEIENCDQPHDRAQAELCQSTQSTDLCPARGLHTRAPRGRDPVASSRLSVLIHSQRHPSPWRQETVP